MSTLVRGTTGPLQGKWWRCLWYTSADLLLSRAWSHADPLLVHSNDSLADTLRMCRETTAWEKQEFWIRRIAARLSSRGHSTLIERHVRCLLRRPSLIHNCQAVSMVCSVTGATKLMGNFPSRAYCTKKRKITPMYPSCLNPSSWFTGYQN